MICRMKILKILTRVWMFNVDHHIILKTKHTTIKARQFITMPYGVEI